jgi:hypothetical protein
MVLCANVTRGRAGFPSVRTAEDRSAGRAGTSDNVEKLCAIAEWTGVDFDRLFAQLPSSSVKRDVHAPRFDRLKINAL